MKSEQMFICSGLKVIFEGGRRIVDNTATWLNLTPVIACDHLFILYKFVSHTAGVSV